MLSPLAEIKSYRAKTLRDALRLVHQELGPAAAVLQTREVWDGWLGGLLGQRRVEVTASAGVNLPRRLAASRELAPPERVDELPRRAVPPADVEDFASKFRRDLRSDSRELPSWLSQLPQHDHPGESTETVFRLFTQLVEADISEEIARDLVAQVAPVPRPMNLLM